MSAPSISAQLDDLAAGRTTSEQLVQMYLARIADIDRGGPALQAVLSLNPQALDVARKRDAERGAHAATGALHGVPILLKDNIETADPMPTTAGSLALRRNVSGRDATLAAKLRAAGAVILGKTNLSEWANMRGSRSVSGWSGVGGLTPQSVVAGPLGLRLKLGQRCRRCSGAGRGRDRHRDRRVRLPVPLRSTASSGSSRRSAWCRATTSCRSLIARTPRGRWRATCGTRHCFWA